MQHDEMKCWKRSTLFPTYMNINSRGIDPPSLRQQAEDSFRILEVRPQFTWDMS